MPRKIRPVTTITAILSLSSVIVLLVSGAAVAQNGSKPSGGGEESFESLSAKAVAIYDLRSVLRPFVATCDDKKGRFRRLFCEALNDRLKAQHQSKIYRYTVGASEAGPLVVDYKGRPKPAVDVTVRGCLTCAGPMLSREGGDITEARFFVFKMPKAIRIRRGRRRKKASSLYQLVNIDVTEQTAPLAPKTKAKVFDEKVRPHLRLDLLFRPVAGVTKVGGRFKYGVLNFELLGHRVYDKCSGKVYLSKPPMKGSYKVDKEDLSCPQNQPKAIVKKPKLPAKLPAARVKRLMGRVRTDLQACYQQFGVRGDVPADIQVLPTGAIKHVKVVGKLAGTPPAKCVERLVRNLKFPPFKGRPAHLQWPFSLSD